MRGNRLLMDNPAPMMAIPPRDSAPSVCARRPDNSTDGTSIMSERLNPLASLRLVKCNIEVGHTQRCDYS